MRYSPGCACCNCAPGSTVLSFTVLGCFGFPLSGILVEVTQSDGSVVSGVTNSSGVCAIGILVHGAYVWVAHTGPRLSGDVTSTGSIACGGSFGYTVDLSNHSIYAGTCCCNTILLPSVMHLTTVAGTIAISTSTAGGSQTVIVNAYDYPFPTVCATDCFSGAGMRAVGVSFGLVCPTGAGTPGLHAVWAIGACPNEGPTGVWLPVHYTGGCPIAPHQQGCIAPWPGAGACDPTLPVNFTIPNFGDPGGFDGGTCPCPVAGPAVLSL